MIPCISQLCTLSAPFQDELTDFSAAGFKTVEIWMTKLEQQLQRNTLVEIKGWMERTGICPVAASIQGGLFRRDEGERAAAWELFRRRLRMLAELNIPMMIVAADILLEDLAGTRNPLEIALESLAEIAAVGGRAGVRVALEFQPQSAFITNLGTAAAMVVELAEPSLTVCLDLVHFQSGPSKLADLQGLEPHLIGHVQVADIGDIPRELATDRDRILPGDGAIDIRGAFSALREIGYVGPISVELANPLLWRVPAIQVATSAWGALRRCGLAHSVSPGPS